MVKVSRLVSEVDIAHLMAQPPLLTKLAVLLLCCNERGSGHYIDSKP